MILIKADPENNVFYLVLGGVLTADNLPTIKKIVESEVSKIKSGFSVYHDARSFQPLNEDLYLEILEIAKIILAKEPDKIARLFNPYSRMIFNRISAQLGYSAKEFHSEKDARSYLNITSEVVKSTKDE